MQELTIEEMIEKEKYLKNMSEYTYFVSEEEFYNIKNSDKVVIDNQEISVEYLKMILQNDKCFQYAHKFFINENSKFLISYIKSSKIGGIIYFEKSQIIKGLMNLISTEQLKINDKEQKRYENLKEIISFEKLLETIKDKYYDINIDNDNYSFSIEKILSFMQISEEDFKKICFNQEIEDVDGINKEHFIYACYRYIKDNRILNNYLLPDIILDKYKDIESNEKLDLQAINCNLTTINPELEKVKIDEELEKLIMGNIPEDASELEVPIYIYIKMCKELTYDDEYYAVNQLGPATMKHKNFQYITSITPSNNIAVCYEFILIYLIFLSKRGVSLTYNEIINEQYYGISHSTLEFRVGKFLIKADAVTSIFNGDIANVKLNRPLEGLKCLNTNKTTQQEFKEAVTRMYQLVANSGKSEKVNVEHLETFEEILEEYSINPELKPITLDDKLSILIHKVNKTNIIGTDSLSYILYLKKVLFSEEEIKNNFHISFIRDNETIDKNKVAMASVIFTLNKRCFEDYPYHNFYYYFNPKIGMLPISISVLQENFDNGVYEYIEKIDANIPGITLENNEDYASKFKRIRF